MVKGREVEGRNAEESFDVLGFQRRSREDMPHPLVHSSCGSGGHHSSSKS
jgi:hypothetical protein